ncbi:MAG TPA: metallophosphoesterase [Myxococcaceae bacterium]|nr:metallophosphoesterase [Myxococcaceae bacterium]
MRFLHCSDVHVTANYDAIPIHKLGWRRSIALLELKFGGRATRYAQAHEVLARIAAECQHREVDHIILSGDVTAYALDEEFRVARESLGDVASNRRRCTVIPGNHDVYTPGAAKEARFHRYFGHLVESDLPEYRREGPFPFVRLLGEDAAVVGLNSARVPAVPGFSFGWVGKAQLEGLDALLADPRLANRAVLVTVHHAPFRHTGEPDRPLHGLKDAKELLKRLPGPRFALLHGHIHKRYHHEATSERPHIFGAGSSTEAGHGGFWIIEAKDGRIQSGQMVAFGTSETPEPADAHA